ncbi:hypothetical protein I79_000414 [Cricetulus griseus]|uniref:Uncharacterized protein n=1 Tax=Cricetulus griseus TaxID=10029 RepID=G3GS97_CRIGR|nr:hypothetical protein I79_000414 [Cricetulus griseus]
MCVPGAPWKPEECIRWIRSPRTQVTDGCELPCRCSELNPGPLEDQTVFFVT